MHLTLQDFVNGTPCLNDYEILNNLPQREEYNEVCHLSHLVVVPRNNTMYVADDNLLYSRQEAETFFAHCAALHSVALVLKGQSPLYLDMLENPHWLKCGLIVAVTSACTSEALCIELLRCMNQFTQARFRNINVVISGFFRMSLQKKGIEAMVHYFKEVIGNPVAIFDECFQCILATDDYLRNPGKIRAVSENFHLNNLYFNKQKISVAGSGEYSLLSFPISFEGKAKAYLSILEINRKISEMDYLILEIAASSILMEMKHTLGIKAIQERNVNNFLYDLFYRADKHIDEFNSLSKALGLDPDSDFFTVVIDVHTSSTKFLAPRTLSNVLRPTRADEVFSLITGELQESGCCLVLGQLGESIIALCRPDINSDDAFASVNKSMRKISDDLRKYFNDSVLMAGIGNISHGISQAESGYLNAKNALMYAKVTAKKGENMIVLYQNNMFIKLLSSVGSREAFQEIIPKELETLYRYDLTHQTQLIITLSVYFECDCNARLAAKQLFIHYKTMLYRLNKIKEITSFNLSDSNEKIQLSLGIAIMKILQMEPFNQNLSKQEKE